MPMGIARLARELAGMEPEPEQANDGPEMHLSRRIVRHLPEYKGRKASAGPIAAARMGLPRLREACPHFGAWVPEL